MTPTEQFWVDVLKQMVALAGILVPLLSPFVFIIVRKLSAIEDNSASTMRKAGRTEHMVQDIKNAGTPAPFQTGTVFREYAELPDEERQQAERTNPRVILPGLAKK